MAGTLNTFINTQDCTGVRKDSENSDELLQVNNKELYMLVFIDSQSSTNTQNNLTLLSISIFG